MSRNKKQKMSQHHIHDNSNSFNITKSFNNVWNNCTISDDRTPILDWLSALEPKLRHRDIQERRVGNIGEWLLRTEEFGGWRAGGGESGDDKAVLFYYGAPGVGKTFLSSLVVDRLCDQTRGQCSAVTCFYFDFAARKEHSVTNMLGSLLKQIVSGIEEIPEEISRTFQEQRMAIGGRGPQLSDIVKMLQTITASLRTFVCIDALDECAAGHRTRLLNSLQQILEKSPSMRILIIGRPHIRAEIEKRLAGRVTSVYLGPRKDDIVEYLRVRLEEDETPDAMDGSLEADILEKIPENMSEMFLLASLGIDAILHESTISRRREKLRKIAGGLELGDVYGATIERIKAQDGDKSRLGMAALMWISHAERPLRVDELRHALAVELGSTDFDVGNVPSMSTLVSCCQGLITVDKEASTVRLVHFTLQEYLSTRPDIFIRPHSAMAEICLTYLNSRQGKALANAVDSDMQKGTFLEYCSVNWGVHAKRELSDSGRSLALELLNENYCETSTKLLLEQTKHYPTGYYYYPHAFSGLHCASFFGIVEVVAGLIEMGCYHMNGGDALDFSPLTWAARNGHEEVVKMLLGQEEVDPDKPDIMNRTPLSHAAAYRHEGVVNILLEGRVVNPDKPDCVGQTPLSYAAQNGYEGLVKILLEREEVNPDKPDSYCQTPLSYAARNGHEGVVEVLLGREEVNADKPGNSGGTPLSYAALGGHEGVVKILLGREEVNPDKPDNFGGTPLSNAARNGHERVVKILLGQKEVSPDKPDGRGRTPLWHASWRGYDEVVKTLLRREEVNPDKADNNGRTPRSMATQCGRDRVVALLHSHKAVTPTMI